MQNLMKSTAIDPAPGLSFTENATHHLFNNNNSSTSTSNLLNSDTNTPKSSSSATTTPTAAARPLKQSLDDQKRNAHLQSTFNLPPQEHLLATLPATLSVSGTHASFHGNVYLSSSFLCFVSLVKYQCAFGVPYFW